MYHSIRLARTVLDIAFARRQITGKIEKVEDIEGADKLYKLEVDIGDEKRTLAAGITAGTMYLEGIFDTKTLLVAGPYAFT